MPCSRTHCSARCSCSGVVSVADVKAGSVGVSTMRTTCGGANASSALPQAVACTGSRAGGARTC